MPAIINYGGNNYVLRDQLVLQQISEFNTAIRQGAASNDDRNLASFFSFEDARAGIGTIFGSVREDPDKLADNAGLITMKMNQMILPPRAYERDWGAPDDPEAGPVLDEDFKGGIFYEDPQTNIATARQLLFAWNHRIWRVGAGDSVEFVYWTENANDVYADTSHITQMLRYVSPVDGASLLYFAGAVNETGIADVVRYADDSEFISQPTAVTGIDAEMLFIFDGKLWAGGNNTLWWSIDPTDPAAWNITEPSGAWPYSWKFIGVFPFGDFNFWPYVLADYDGNAHIAVVDLDAYTITPLALGLQGIIAAFPHQGKICIIHTNGTEVTLLDAGSLTQMPLDWNARSRDGFTAQRKGIARAGTSHPDGVVIAASNQNSDGEQTSQLFMHRGSGWHPYGRVSSSPHVPIAVDYSTAEVTVGVQGVGEGLAPQTFTESGTYTVPDGITELDIDVQGAQGGAGRSGLAGGRGARVQGRITVTPAEELDLFVGTAGGAGTSGAGTAGSNGGAGGTAGAGAAGGGVGSGGGGGMSSIERSTTPLAIAGGGGGSSRDSAGGSGGAVVGTAGASSDGGGGGGGTALAGGAAGTADGDGGSAGAVGSAETGGAGGAANSAITESDAGGGGGAGLYGGGGGGGATGEAVTPTVFSYTGGSQSYVVPVGITSILVDAYGAEGGEEAGDGSGGLGARVQTTLAVTPGETLTVRVGGKGVGHASGGAGGYNGGGTGDGTIDGSGGGGASDVRRGAGRLVVAGGGGGGGQASADGGNGGGLTGVAGENALTSTGGGGGTGSSGGLGGTNGVTAEVSGHGGDSGAGSGGAGKAGGGGGGGGWNGGGGGGGGNGGAGGGGGSSISLGTAITYTAGARTGDGQVTITPDTGAGDGGGGGGGGSSYIDPTATNVVTTEGYRSGSGQIVVSPVTSDVSGEVTFNQERFYMLLSDASLTEEELLMYDIRWFNEPFAPGDSQGYEMEFNTVSAITPWFDMGFNELDGTMLVLSHGGYADDDNTILVEYQVDFSSTWTELGSFPNTTPSVPEISTRTSPVQNARTLLFDSLTGVTFRQVRFRFTLESTAERQTPNAYPMTLRFVKRPDMRDSIRIAIDVEQTIQMRGDISSFDDIWMELKALYDQDTVPQLLAGPVTTWAAMIALPRVLDISDLAEDDVARSENSEEVVIVFNVVELV